MPTSPSAKPVTDTLKEAVLRLPRRQREVLTLRIDAGLTFAEVTAGSPAEAAGLEPGDTIDDALARADYQLSAGVMRLYHTEVPPALDQHPHHPVALDHTALLTDRLDAGSYLHLIAPDRRSVRG